MVLLVLAVLWAAVLLPPLLRSRSRNTRNVDSIGDFNYKLGVLRSTNGAPPPAASPRRTVTRVAAAAPVFGPVRASATQRAAKRRGDVLRGLVIAVALTMALAYFSGSSLLWGVQIVADVALLAFLGLWAYARNVQLATPEPVHYLPQRRAPELALRRTASS